MCLPGPEGVHRPFSPDSAHPPAPITSFMLMGAFTLSTEATDVQGPGAGVGQVGHKRWCQGGWLSPSSNKPSGTTTLLMQGDTACVSLHPRLRLGSWRPQAGLQNCQAWGWSMPFTQLLTSSRILPTVKEGLSRLCCA